MEKMQRKRDSTIAVSMQLVETFENLSKVSKFKNFTGARDGLNLFPYQALHTSAKKGK